MTPRLQKRRGEEGSNKKKKGKTRELQILYECFLFSTSSDTLVNGKRDTAAGRSCVCSCNNVYVCWFHAPQRSSYFFFSSLSSLSIDFFLFFLCASVFVFCFFAAQAMKQNRDQMRRCSGYEVGDEIGKWAGRERKTLSSSSRQSSLSSTASRKEGQRGRTGKCRRSQKLSCIPFLHFASSRTQALRKVVQYSTTSYAWSEKRKKRNE